MQIRHTPILILLILSTILLFFGTIFYFIHEDQTQAKKTLWTIIQESHTSNESIGGALLSQQVEYLNLALQEKKQEWCEKIQDAELKKTCHESYNRILAIAEENMEICTLLPEIQDRNHCSDTIRSKQAIREDKKETCLTIKNLQIRNSCEVSIENRLYLKTKRANILSIIPCESFSGEIRKNCEAGNIQANEQLIQSTAKKQKNSTLCENIKDANRQQRCKNEVYYLQGISNKSSKLCESIDDAYLQKACRIGIQ